MYKIFVERRARKFLSRLNPKSYRIISDTIRKLSPFPKLTNLDIKPLKGKYHGMFRLRIGSRRVLFTIDYIKKEIRIWIVEDRGDIY